TNLYSLALASPTSFPINTDGANPYDGLVLSGNTLYGTALNGGDGGEGTVFKLGIDGTGFDVLHSFMAFDGAGPNKICLSGDAVYGTAGAGGASNNQGTVFKVNTDGTGFVTLHSFSGLDGANPYAGLTVSGTTLYGTAYSGGSSGNGTVFALNTDGANFRVLHSFTGGEGGRSPHTELVLSGDTLYGTTINGGSSGQGTVYALNTDGTGFTTLHSFSATTNGTNSDGALPHHGPILSGGTLYGTASVGGTSGRGTVFSISLPVFPPSLTISASRQNVILTWSTNA